MIRERIDDDRNRAYARLERTNNVVNWAALAVLRPCCVAARCLPSVSAVCRCRSALCKHRDLLRQKLHGGAAQVEILDIDARHAGDGGWINSHATGSLRWFPRARAGPWLRGNCRVVREFELTQAGDGVTVRA